MAIVVNRSISSSDPQKMEMLNWFYPVGSYYETSDTTFDPNVSWGGTWVEDTAGKTTIALDTGTFDTVGDTGGSETHAHTIDARIRLYFGAAGCETSRALDIVDENGNRGTTATDTGMLPARSNVSINSGFQSSMTTIAHDGFGQKVLGSSYSASTLPPYVVVKRWHRVA